MSEKDLLEIIAEVDNQEKYFGIIPIYPIYQRVKIKFTINEFHSLILEMESKNLIYLETINDINRLNIEEKNTAIYDPVRGYLYYIGRW